jgi:uncharacterized surface protein with fasciclin (FAS1) repeats
MAADQDIVDTAAGNPQFLTLLAAVKAASLVDIPEGAGPLGAGTLLRSDLSGD